MQRTCLIADDDTVSREILRAYMEDRGFAVSAVANGNEALFLCTAKQFDCIFVDWEMPTMNGVEFLEQYPHKTGSNHPVFIMYTTHDRTENIAKVRDLGVQIYLIKPVKREELDITLSKAGLI